MSWIKENYHIAALGGGALVLAGLGYAGYSGNATVNEELVAPIVNEKVNTTTPGGPEAAALTKLVTEVDDVKQPATAVGRPVDLFTSVDLYTREGRPNELLDLLQMSGPVHPPIRNQWWVDHRIDPSFSDSPTRDQDGDGFSNLEEYTAQTDPNDPASHGALIEKLEVVEVESDMWLLLFKSVLGDGYQFDLQFKPFGQRTQTNRIPAGSKIQKGDTFFAEDPGKDRFKLADIESREEQTSTGVRPRDWAIIEDQLPSKNGAKYEMPFSPKVRRYGELTQYDHRVVFRLNAIGEESNNFKVGESATFALPASGAEKGYKLVEVKLGDIEAGVRKAVSVVVEYKDGEETKTREIPVPVPPSEPEPDNG